MQYLFVRILKARGLAHNESPYVVLFLLEDLALAGDDLAPDLIDGFRNRNGIRGFDGSWLIVVPVLGVGFESMVLRLGSTVLSNLH